MIFFGGGFPELSHKTKQGEKAANTEKSAVTKVNELKGFVKNIVKAEATYLEGNSNYYWMI